VRADGVPIGVEPLPLLGGHDVPDLPYFPSAERADLATVMGRAEVSQASRVGSVNLTNLMTLLVRQSHAAKEPPGKSRATLEAAVPPPVATSGAAHRLLSERTDSGALCTRDGSLRGTDRERHESHAYDVP
jgi:hypothetical protein